MAPTRTAQPAATVRPRVVKTRWRKTSTTFGPAGRIIATLALVIPFGFFLAIAIISGGFVVGGAVVWGLFVMPLGLRDVWKAGKVSSG